MSRIQLSLLTFALTMARPAVAMNGVKAGQRLRTAAMCEQILARTHFRLDDAIADHLVDELGPNLFAFRESQIDPREVSALERLLVIKGGRALAIGTVASQNGVPAVDGIHYGADGTRQLLSIKTSIVERTNGISFLRSHIFGHRGYQTRLLSKEGLVKHYGLNKAAPIEADHFKRTVVDTILRIWDLEETPSPRVLHVLDLAAASALTPALRVLAEVFPLPNSERARRDDTILMIRHAGRDPGTPSAFNIDQFIRELRGDPWLAGVLVLFKDQYFEVDATGFALRTLPR